MAELERLQTLHHATLVLRIDAIEPLHSLQGLLHCHLRTGNRPAFDELSKHDQNKDFGEQKGRRHTCVSMKCFMPQHLDIWFRFRRLFLRTDGLDIFTESSLTHTDDGAGKMSSRCHKDGPQATLFERLLKGF
jgi:hypothetical protein